MSETPVITVVIPARDAASTLPWVLDGLAAQRIDGAFEVIVVDDGSSDATASVARASPVVDKVLASSAAGPASARNLGAAEADAPMLAFLDADCRPDPGWLAAGVAALQTADLVLGETRPRPDRECGPYDRTLWVVGRSPLFEAANLFVTRELFERLHGFESWLGPARGKELGEDVLFGWRAVRAGARVGARPDARAHHEVYARGPLAFAAERWRLRFFPPMARRIPELRDRLFHRRYFLTARQLRFDAAVVALILAAASRRPLLAAAALPYARVLWRDLREAGTPGPPTVRLGADAVAFSALLYGSVRSRSPLL